MLSDRARRLIAGVLLLLVLGWAVRWYRGRTTEEAIPAGLPPGVQDVTSPVVDLPRE